jgi:saccharopine dehydrogenase (NAD+, L-lysine-forming)
LYLFEDIEDAKHRRYLTHPSVSTLFWGIGLENETYLMTEMKDAASFATLQPKRERYSIDYYKSFAREPLERVLRVLRDCPSLHYPLYVNAHTFQKTDPSLEHRTLYNAHQTPNRRFTESIHDHLMRACETYRTMNEISMVFDGDTIEFITQKFHCTTVSESLNELVEQKEKWRQAVSPFFEQWGIGTLQFPTHSHGLVSFITTHGKNLSLCNTGTLHINLTLPTWLENGQLRDRTGFARDHLAFIRMIQVVEPLLAACYGTPDVFSVIDPAYSIGSQRGTRSRYISLQTFDVAAPVNGKLLICPRPTRKEHWYSRLMSEGPYLPHTEVGYDVNFNKFKNHGVEIRFLDAFPEAYLGDVMNFFVLLAQHAVVTGNLGELNRSEFDDIIVNCLRLGQYARLTVPQAQRILHELRISAVLVTHAMSAFDLLRRISDTLYDHYHSREVVSRMSPGMKRPALVCYNAMAFRLLREGIGYKPRLVIRAEVSPVERRVPLVPVDVQTLGNLFDIFVESSSTRCYSDDDYRAVGAKVIPAGTWTTIPHAVVVGLKALRAGEEPTETQTLLHFAHAYYQQAGWQETLRSLRRCAFVDYEFLVGADGRRMLSFCDAAGRMGTLLVLMAYYGLSVSGGAYDVSQMEDRIRQARQEAEARGEAIPRILLLGYGAVGSAAHRVLQCVGLDGTVKRSQDQVTAEDILGSDLLIHTIRIPSKGLGRGPFLTDADIDRPGRRLRWIADISCDLEHPENPLPIYRRYGTWEQPVQRLREFPPLDLLAVPYFPSFDPVRSSDEFSSRLVWYLPEVVTFRNSPSASQVSASLYRSYLHFLKMLEMVPVLPYTC